MRILRGIVCLGLVLSLPVLSFGQMATAVKCGTPEVSARKGAKSVLYQLPLVFRDSTISPSGRFVIHYDASSSDPDSVASPEFVRWAANLADSAYQLEVVELGYAAPPTSSNGRYDIYLSVKPYSAYGATFPMDNSNLAPSASGMSRYRSYIMLDNRFTDPIYATQGYDALRITLFHEFFHVIQFGDFGHASDNSFFEEMSSVWMEMESSPSILDWMNPGFYGVGHYMATIDLSWNKSPGGGYGQGIFLKYLDTLYTPAIIHEIWSYLRDTSSDPSRAVDAVLASHGSGFCSAYLGFGTELVECGRRHVAGNVLRDAALLPADSLHVVVLDTGATSFSLWPESLGIFLKGFGGDTCAAIVSRNTTQTIENGDVRIPSRGSAIVNMADPASGCDTSVCLPARAFAVAAYPNPYHPERDGTMSFAITDGEKPASIYLDIYTPWLVPLGHFVPPVEWVGDGYGIRWSGTDDGGHRLSSGEYVYALTVDGRRTFGKLVIVNGVQ